MAVLVVGRRSVPPARWRHWMRRSPTAIPWRERPREMAAWPASLRPRTRSLTPTGEGCRRRHPAISPRQILREFRAANGPVSVPRSLAHSRHDSRPDCTRVF